MSGERIIAKVSIIDKPILDNIVDNNRSVNCATGSTIKIQKEVRNRIVLQVARYGYMDIQSKVIKNTDNKSPVKAYATVCLNNNIAIHGFRIIDIGTDDDALYVAMPSNRNSDGKYYDMAFPTRSEVKEDLSLIHI